MKHDTIEDINIITNSLSECRIGNETAFCSFRSDFSCISSMNSIVLIEGLGTINILTNLTANSHISLPMITTVSAAFQAEMITQNIVNNFFKHVAKLIDEGKLQESIKESYKAFDYILDIKNIDLADKILSYEDTDLLPTSVLISFLNSTSNFKTNLKNRDKIFEKIKKKVTAEIGEENFNKSLYFRLK